MSDDNQQQGTEGQDGGSADPLKNVKAEFDRKLDNVIKQQNEQLQAILAQVTERMAPPPQQQTSSKPLSDMIYSNPDEAANIITQRAIDAASRVVDDRVARSQAAQNTVNEVMAHYPEFGQVNSEAAALAIKKMQSLPKDQQGSTIATKTVMLEAAAELGLIPAKSRKQSSDDDSFSVSSGARSGSQGQQRNRDGKTKVSAETIEFAQLMGIDTNDPARMKGLEKASQRTKWNKYE